MWSWQIIMLVDDERLLARRAGKELGQPEQGKSELEMQDRCDRGPRIAMQDAKFGRGKDAGMNAETRLRRVREHGGDLVQWTERQCCSLLNDAEVWKVAEKML